MSVVSFGQFRAPAGMVVVNLGKPGHLFRAVDGSGAVLRFSDVSQFEAWALGRTDVLVESVAQSA